MLSNTIVNIIVLSKETFVNTSLSIKTTLHKKLCYANNLKNYWSIL